ncbi:hypothetical protein B0J17DRAFT_692390 [Rhizoctonia solani]|nr:hypothetical protein B0J17DRAFT_692390 [Rhizoctonia solani]
MNTTSRHGYRWIKDFTCGALKHMGKHVTERTTEYMTIRVRREVRRAYVKQIMDHMGRLGTSLQMFPRIIREIERQVMCYVTQWVEQKIRKHMRTIGRQIRAQRDAIGGVIARVKERAQGRIAQQLRRSIAYYYNPSDLLHVGKDQNMKISEFCGLDLVGQVIMIECFQDVDHGFILVHSKGLRPDTPSDQMVWIRLERGVKQRSVGYFQAMFRKATPIYDSATISYQFKSVTPTDASPIRGNTLVFNNLEAPVTLNHLTALLGMMDETTSGYNPLKDNCWDFCQAVIDCMEPYQSKAIRVRDPDANRERRQALKRRFTDSITDLRSYGFTSES